MSSKQTWKFKVNGVVQGVGFRYFCLREANALGIAGWVKNLPDGTVESLGIGSSEQLEIYAEALKRGPRLSRVESVDINRNYSSSDSTTAVNFDIR